MRTPEAWTAFEIRPAEADDAPALQSIELDAARRYGSYDKTRFCLDLPARGDGEHKHARDKGIALVAAVAGAPVGFILAIPRDRGAHILEIAVASGQQGRGYGRALIAAAEDWAVRKGFHEVTLTTFRNVAWNAPFYAGLGYDVFDVGPDRPELGALIAEEREMGVHGAPRVAMRKALPAGHGPGARFVVRPERPDEFQEIHELVEKAFESAHYAEGDEQDFVDRQRNSQFYLPELALVLVLEDGDHLIAYVMLTQASVSTAAGPSPILLLACIAVAAERRNQGIGTELIEAALQRARNLGHTAVILVGDPAYYARLAFLPSTRFGITNENGIEAEYVQLRELAPGALREVSGGILLPG